MRVNINKRYTKIIINFLLLIFCHFSQNAFCNGINDFFEYRNWKNYITAESITFDYNKEIVFISINSSYFKNMKKQLCYKISFEKYEILVKKGILIGYGIFSNPTIEGGYEGILRYKDEDAILRIKFIWYSGIGYVFFNNCITMTKSFFSLNKNGDINARIYTYKGNLILRVISTNNIEWAPSAIIEDNHKNIKLELYVTDSRIVTKFKTERIQIIY